MLLSIGKENLGYGKAHNYNVANTSFPYIVISNCDLVVPDGWDKLVQILMTNPDIGAVCPKFKNQGPARDVIEEIPEEKLKIVDRFCGAFFAIPREVFRNAGGFSPEYFLTWEETDLLYTIRYKIGLKVAEYQNLVINHRIQGSRIPVEKMKHFYIDGARIFKKKWRNYLPDSIKDTFKRLNI